jgi:crotonobetainyl-CoA:carnitine CoA-transferase CaiB-like acyl-CoA transferase
MMRPLEGLRILTIEQYGAGPYGTMLLAELGAEVIKVENPATGGDVSRATGPYFLGENDGQYFQTFSRSKKSVALDLKSVEGQADFKRLVASADAVVNNLRGDQPAKLGLTYAALKATNPRIVCAHLSAYGRGNSREAYPGFDYLMQAEAGFLYMTGEPDGPPVRFGLSIIDFMTGSIMAVGLLAAVMKARQSGEGCDVDAALFDTAVHQLSYPGVWYLNEKEKTERLPRGAHPASSPSQLFPSKDGWVMIMCQSQKFWEDFCRLAAVKHLIDDPRFPSPGERRKNIVMLTDEMDLVTRTRTTDEWVSLLSGTVPVAPVYDIGQALDNPFLNEIGLIDTVVHPNRPQGLRMLTAPLKINGKRMPGRRAPKLGEHTDELLGRKK